MSYNSDLKIQVIDFFAGGGGASKGFIDAGAYVCLAVDSWESAMRLHELNHPKIPFILTELGGDFEETYLMVDEFIEPTIRHIHLHGSPPCQALSNASNTNSIEGYIMVKWFIDFAKYLGDKLRALGYTYSWSMENVRPVAKYLKKDDIPYEIINSADVGVPQTRIRVFAGEGWKYKPTHNKENWVSVIQALPYLHKELTSTEGNKNNFKNRDLTSPSPTITSQSYVQMKVSEIKVKSCRGAGEKSGRKKDGSIGGGIGDLYRSINEPNYTIRSRRHTLYEFVKIESHGSTGNRSKDRTINQPNHTICGSGNLTGQRIYDHQNNEPRKLRSLTIEENCILQGYEGFKWKHKDVKKGDCWKIVGNMVCPPVAKAIIEGIRNFKPQPTLFEYGVIE